MLCCNSATYSHLSVVLKNFVFFYMYNDWHKNLRRLSTWLRWMRPSWIVAKFLTFVLLMLTLAVMTYVRALQLLTLGQQDSHTLSHTISTDVAFSCLYKQTHKKLRNYEDFKVILKIFLFSNILQKRSDQSMLEASAPAGREIYPGF